MVDECINKNDNFLPFANKGFRSGKYYQGLVKIPRKWHKTEFLPKTLGIFFIYTLKTLRNIQISVERVLAEKVGAKFLYLYSKHP